MSTRTYVLANSSTIRSHRWTRQTTPPHPTYTLLTKSVRRRASVSHVLSAPAKPIVHAIQALLPVPRPSRRGGTNQCGELTRVVVVRFLDPSFGQASVIPCGWLGGFERWQGWMYVHMYVRTCALVDGVRRGASVVRSKGLRSCGRCREEMLVIDTWDVTPF